jgi:pimeloyl-ACP methyl ester carboxylesterase
VILTHGWPSSFLEYLPLVPLLTANGFDVVVPSLPGYAFSAPLPHGEFRRVPELWVRLMTDVLGYERFGAYGGDVGGMVTNRLAREYPERLIGIHVSFLAEPHVKGPLSSAERAFVDARPRGLEEAGAYAHVQRTRPQTLAFALADSPVGLAAWILDRWRAWSHDFDRFTKDELLTTVMLFWATRTIGTSFRVYRDWALGSGSRPEAWSDDVPPGVERPLAPGEQIRVPAAVALREALYPREWAERAYADLCRFVRLPDAGHFAAMEDPAALAEDIRAFFGKIR